ncbi:hypothetical protein TWF730_009269 [Orbilia blumenaviensis]|uniref:Uncharacterized protein n=1 Tax=Orbilia blumenaviensis TaxID=1796055 RepID=A0AAV9UY32_9PEZI
MQLLATLVAALGFASAALAAPPPVPEPTVTRVTNIGAKAEPTITRTVNPVVAEPTITRTVNPIGKEDREPTVTRIVNPGGKDNQEPTVTRITSTRPACTTRFTVTTSYPYVSTRGGNKCATIVYKSLAAIPLDLNCKGCDLKVVTKLVGKCTKPEVTVTRSSTLLRIPMCYYFPTPVPN